MVHANLDWWIPKKDVLQSARGQEAQKSGGFAAEDGASGSAGPRPPPRPRRAARAAGAACAVSVAMVVEAGERSGRQREPAPVEANMGDDRYLPRPRCGPSTTSRGRLRIIHKILNARRGRDRWRRQRQSIPIRSVADASRAKGAEKLGCALDQKR